ncbi:hypothetical protein OY671_008785, partial [Metschnikowia pulcherrima]
MRHSSSIPNCFWPISSCFSTDTERPADDCRPSPNEGHAMDPLASATIAAHGGSDQWKRFTTLSARLAQGGALWPLKGVGGVSDDTVVTIDSTRQQASHAPFGDAARKSAFAPHRVALVSGADTVVEESADPRASFAGHTLETP